MTEFVEVPPQRLEASVLDALLQEFASRDGTDYGERELSLAQKVAQLRRQLDRGELLLLYEVETEHWDLLPQEQARQLLDE
jgi:uncharacterized protein YheU (UPF0270 family)